MFQIGGHFSFHTRYEFKSGRLPHASPAEMMLSSYKKLTLK